VASSHGESPGYEELLALVEEQPDSVEPLVVLADWLQLREHPRGELIALQLAKETATGDAWERLEQRTAEHLVLHAAELVPSVGAARLRWRRGFVHRVEIGAEMTLLAGTLEQWARQPSMRLLRELSVELNSDSGANLRPLPITLHKLEVRGLGGAISDLLPSAPALRTLAIEGVTDLEALRHPALRELTVIVPRYVALSGYGEASSLGAQLTKLESVALPSLRRLSLVVPHEFFSRTILDEACRGLGESSLLRSVTQIELVGNLSVDGAAALQRGRAGQPALEWLRVRDSSSTQLSRELRSILQPLCRELVHNSPEKPPCATRANVDEPRERLVRNRFKPSWGVGRVLGERDGGIEVEFEEVGVRFLRSPELLVDVVD
jgi:uncharacterized protein (TIGR02996 family)